MKTSTLSLLLLLNSKIGTDAFSLVPTTTSTSASTLGNVAHKHQCHYALQSSSLYSSNNEIKDNNINDINNENENDHAKESVDAIFQDFSSYIDSIASSLSLSSQDADDDDNDAFSSFILGIYDSDDKIPRSQSQTVTTIASTQTAATIASNGANTNTHTNTNTNAILASINNEEEFIQQIIKLQKSYHTNITNKKYGPTHIQTTTALSTLIQVFHYYENHTNNKNDPYEYYTKIKNTLEQLLQFKNKVVQDQQEQQQQEQEVTKIDELYKHDYIIFQSLAYYYMKLGMYNSAQELYKDVIYEIQSATIGKTHIDTLSTIHTIANIYSITNDYQNARYYYLKCYTNRKSTIGTNHEDTILTLQHLLNLYIVNEKYYIASIVSDKCFKYIFDVGMKEDMIQPNTTFMTFHNLALYYQHQHNYHYGNEHQHDNQHDNQQDQTQYDKARKLYEQCVTQQVKTIGKNDIDTILTLHNLSTLYHDMEEYNNGLRTCQLCFTLRYNILGLYDYDTILTLCNLGVLYQRVGDYVNARDTLELCLDLQCAVLGEDHGDCHKTINYLLRLNLEMERVRS